MARTPHGSAAKNECEKCHDMISRSNFSKHAKKCSGIKVRESRSDIRKKSLEKSRLKRVGSQRNKRATKFFQELQGCSGGRNSKICLGNDNEEG
ncbi:hypothetical protein PF005_g20099 [Phytophthora fragariae]|uniref:Uncharacterized protein n=1 Tax=Phytophthora fragariae TaxID=53985 RepID=A0A6A3SFG3_9STRA|nr:hypothetical protein PF003_g37132 [Phytophthora fragariae]KAE8988849.1 hypothetical protein PF011_g19011 [Phytophthora fragariae]KAE9086234.1 hypothetical protein PF007_g20853 [Phytophthora fragariae]KAE9087940.1 hypothetical protein PF010_g19546 [Phytophthora fragariae]KAE9115954.1 hypothetical protein PF006_g19152 [Phytophthora fragariae]